MPRVASKARKSFIADEDLRILRLGLEPRRLGSGDQVGSETPTNSVPDGTGNRGKHVVGVRTDQTDGSHHDYQHHSEHDRVLGDVLSTLIRPQLVQKHCHGLLLASRLSTSYENEKLLTRSTSAEIPLISLILQM